jgi:DNA primase
VREQVLALFQKYLPGRLRPSGQSNYLTTCPFHKGGEERTPSFSVNVDKGLYHCFTCHDAGTVKGLLKKLGVPRSTIDSETGVIAPYLKQNLDNFKLQRQHTFHRRDPFRTDTPLPETLLAMYDHPPTKLLMDGFDAALLKDLDVGFDRRNKRITYPLRDLYGNLAGISGGATEEGQWPKYKVYEGGSKGRVGDFGAMFDEQYASFTCKNHDLLWNYDRVYPRVTSASDLAVTVNVVEGFKACMWMLQSGYPNTVALMGSYVSDIQQRLLHRLGCTLVLFLDNDEAGRKATLNVGDLLWKPMHGKVRVVPYPEADVDMSMRGEEGTQPDDYESDAARNLVASNVSFPEYVNYMRRSGRW